MPVPEDDLTLLVAVAKDAGEIALSYWRQQPKVWDKGGDQGPVTEADHAVNKMLHDRLLAARPDHGWLSEESPDTPERLSRPCTFIIDPIDGTRAFIAGEDSFSHALAIARDGRVTAAVVFVSARNLLYAATDTAPATCNGTPIRVAARKTLDGAHFLAPKTALSPEHWPGGVPDITRAFRPSIAFRLCLAAEGSFDGMLTLRRSWEWDIAAGSLIAERAGAIVTDASGAHLRFNRADPRAMGVLAASPDLHAALMGRRRIG